MSVNWSELIQQKPHELVISGKNGTDQVDREDGLNELCFKISSLNFLEVSAVGLSKVSPHIGKLSLLTNLVLFGNNLTQIPQTVGNLSKLKFLDVSRNSLTKLPNEIGNLTELQSLIVSDNKLDALPSDLSKLVNLIVVKIDQNCFTQFPESLLNSDNPKVHLTEIHAQRNKIESLPGTVNRLTTLKFIDLRENAITVVTGEIGDCTKLKEINLVGNKLADRRLLKLCEQGKAKQIIDYIRAHCPKTKSTARGRETSNDQNTGAGGGTARNRSVSQTNSEINEAYKDTIKILPVKDDAWYTVTATPMATEQRKVVACLVRNVNLSKEGVLKRFLQLQTGLHDGICAKRTLATIAVHDLSKINGKVNFDVRPPGKLRMIPLNRIKEMTASELYKMLLDEAELLRKEKKRNTFSGVHKYLFLLKGKSRYPCLYDDDGTVISFPPITNSEITRVIKLTKRLMCSLIAN